MFHRPLALALPLALVTGCGASAASSDGTLDVVASFYPLQYVAEQVGGEHVTVSNLTKPGAEPHDLELAPQDVGRLSEADVVLYLQGFQPSVDDAVTSDAAERSLDVTASADLAPADAGHEDHGHSDEGHEGHEGDEGHDDGATDPHFWLDPTRLAAVADAVAQRFAELDADNAADYQAGAERLGAELEALDSEFEQGLAECASHDLVTSHTAFAYLADRYGLHQVGIAGLSAEAEPSAQDLATVARFVRDNDVATIYYETLVSPAIARTVAQETGARTAVLDPLEGLTDASAGDDYLEVMRANLEALREGQSCR